MKAPFALAVLLFLASCTDAYSHRLILQASPAADGRQQQNAQTSSIASPQSLPSGTYAHSSDLNDTWPFPEVPIELMSRGDLLARGGAVRALGRAKLQRIKQQSSVSLAIEALASSMDNDDDLVSQALEGITVDACCCHGLLLSLLALDAPLHACVACCPELRKQQDSTGFTWFRSFCIWQYV
jgi:hypothetical protein